MKLYEIPLELEKLIDPETGEITDIETFNKLLERFENGKEWLALMHKNYSAEAEAIDNEINNLTVRKRVAKNKAQHMKDYLDYLCNGNGFSTPKVQVSYRKSTSVEVDDNFVSTAIGNEDLEQYLRFKDPEVDKTALKNAIKSGFEFEHARLIENKNIQIK